MCDSGCGIWGYLRRKEAKNGTPEDKNGRRGRETGNAALCHMLSKGRGGGGEIVWGKSFGFRRNGEVESAKGPSEGGGVEDRGSFV